jgi:hypothetical protein
MAWQLVHDSDAPGDHEAVPWQPLAQLPAAAFQPTLAATSLLPLLCVASFTVDAL